MNTIPTYNLIGLFIASYFISLLSSLAGIGGGAMLIPIYSLIANLDIRESIVLSIATISGNVFVRAVYYGVKKHKNAKNRSLADYEIAKLIVPFDANTAYLGYLLNKFLPNIIIFILIFI